MIDIRPGIKGASSSDLFRFLVALKDSEDVTDIEFRDEVVAEMKLRKPAADSGAGANSTQQAALQSGKSLVGNG